MIKKPLGKLLSKYYTPLLLLVVILSYGQILGMYVWEDDNALFFKLAHIEGNAGYLGAGPFGEGVYKYTATPFIPIYHLFGFNTVAYFTLALILYFLATIFVYKIFSKIIGEIGGKVAGFLFACGYIASDGFIRLYNTVASSDSIILISLFLLFYWLYYKKKALHFYLFSLLCFWLVTELAMSRSHYLIAVAISFELIFLSFEKPLKSVIYSAIRLLPFGFIFYRYFLVGADSRTGQIGNLAQALLKGQFYQGYSFIASLANLVVPGWVSSFHPSPARWLLLILAALTAVTILYRKKYWKLLIVIALVLLVIWLPLSQLFFTTPVLNLDPKQLFVVFAGGIILILGAIVGWCLEGEKRKLYYFLFLWIILNIAAYGAYNPTFAYVAFNRYLAHSFFALVGLFGLLFDRFYRGHLGKLIAILIVAWGLSNLGYSIFYQHNILQNRSNPARELYTQLQELVPLVNKGDIFYFDVADSAKGYFKDAIAVAQMPETTALAWRYGVDRYDITLFKDFNSFKQQLKSKKYHPEQVHSLFYTTSGLIDTSSQMRQYLFQGSPEEQIKLPLLTSQTRVEPGQKGTQLLPQEMIINLPNPIDSIYPIKLNLGIRASVLDASKLNFPLYENNQPSQLDLDPSLRSLGFEYLKYKDEVRRTADFKASSQWQDRIAANLYDGDLITLWQADRVEWKSHNENITLDLQNIQSIDRLVWVNGFSNQSPTEMSVDVSEDGLNWQTIKRVTNTNRIEPKNLQIITFKPIEARFIRLNITKTLDGDSPAIAEIWPVLSKFSKLDLNEAEALQSHPFRFIQDQTSFETTINNLDSSALISLLWKNDSKGGWQSSLNDQIAVSFDGNLHQYQVILPAGGTKITQLKLTNIKIPGKLILENLSISRPSLLKL